MPDEFDQYLDSLVKERGSDAAVVDEEPAQDFDSFLDEIRGVEQEVASDGIDTSTSDITVDVFSTDLPNARLSMPITFDSASEVLSRLGQPVTKEDVAAKADERMPAASLDPMLTAQLDQEAAEELGVNRLRSIFPWVRSQADVDVINSELDKHHARDLVGEIQRRGDEILDAEGEDSPAFQEIADLYELAESVNPTIETVEGADGSVSRIRGGMSRDSATQFLDSVKDSHEEVYQKSRSTLMKMNLAGGAARSATFGILDPIGDSSKERQADLARELSERDIWGRGGQSAVELVPAIANLGALSTAFKAGAMRMSLSEAAAARIAGPAALGVFSEALGGDFVEGAAFGFLAHNLAQYTGARLSKLPTRVQNAASQAIGFVGAGSAIHGFEVDQALIDAVIGAIMGGASNATMFPKMEQAARRHATTSSPTVKARESARIREHVEEIRTQSVGGAQSVPVRMETAPRPESIQILHRLRGRPKWWLKEKAKELGVSQKGRKDEVAVRVAEAAEAQSVKRSELAQRLSGMSTPELRELARSEAISGRGGRDRIIERLIGKPSEFDLLRTVSEGGVGQRHPRQRMEFGEMEVTLPLERARAAVGMSDGPQTLKSKQSRVEAPVLEMMPKPEPVPIKPVGEGRVVPTQSGDIRTPGDQIAQIAGADRTAMDRVAHMAGAVINTAKHPLRSVRDLWRFIENGTQQFPRTTRADPEASLYASRAANSSAVSQFTSDLYVQKVLKPNKADPNRLGAVLTEDNLRGTKDAYHQEAAGLRTRASELRQQRAGLTRGEQKAERKQLSREIRAVDKAAKDLQALADQLPTLVGKGGFWESEGMYQSDVKAHRQAARDHISFWNEHKEPLFRIRQGAEPEATIPARGRQLGARVNLFPVKKAAELSVRDGPVSPELDARMAQPKEGRLANRRVTRSPFSNRVVGSRRGYVIDAREMMANSMIKEVEGAAKVGLVDALIKSDNARMVDRGKSVEGFVPLTETVRGMAPGKTLVVREALEVEVRNAMRIDKPNRGGPAARFANFINRASLKGLADNFINMARAVKTPLSLPQSGRLKTEAVLNALPPVQWVRIFGSIAKNMLPTAERLDRLVRMANTGAARQSDRTPIRGLFSIINRMGSAMDTAARLHLDRVYDSLVKNGKAPDSPTARRDFVNQVGNYQRAAQGAFTRVMVDSGIQPFQTAKTTRWANRMRRLRLSSGASATSPGARLEFMAERLGRIAGIATLTGAWNYMNTGDPRGLPGQPIGTIYTGKNEDGEPTYMKVYEFYESGEATKVFGLPAGLTALRRGLTGTDAAGSAVRQGLSQIGTTLAGPVPSFAMMALKGETFYEDAPTADPDQSQELMNFGTAIIDMNPMVKLLALKANEQGLLDEDMVKSFGLDKQEGRGFNDELARQISYFAPKKTPDAARMESLPQAVEGAQVKAFIESLKRRGRQVPAEERPEWLRKQISTLSPQDQKRAMKKLRFMLRGE